MFKQNLIILKNDIQQHRRDRELLMQQCIAERLDKSLDTYYKSLKRSVYVASVSEPDRVIKGI